MYQSLTQHSLACLLTKTTAYKPLPHHLLKRRVLVLGGSDKSHKTLTHDLRSWTPTSFEVPHLSPWSLFPLYTAAVCCLIGRRCRTVGSTLTGSSRMGRWDSGLGRDWKRQRREQESVVASRTGRLREAEGQRHQARGSDWKREAKGRPWGLRHDTRVSTFFRFCVFMFLSLIFRRITKLLARRLMPPPLLRIEMLILADIRYIGWYRPKHSKRIGILNLWSVLNKGSDGYHYP